ncbi:MAG: hypothetical protein NTY63_05470 [Candidatus Bipolaricaulota bacterium]|nr:hypothetical protein [Candidatus Bipolaricaulota bacterium]
MKTHDLFFGRGGYAATLVLLIGAGLALVLSMPWAGRVADFFLFPWSPTPAAFFFTLAALGAVHAMNRGAAVEPLPRTRRRQLLSLPLQVSFVQALVLPNVAICTVLLPARHAGLLWMAWGYLGLVNVALGVISFRISARCFHRARHPFFPLLFAACAYNLLPLLFQFAPGPVQMAALVSPAAALWTMLAGDETWGALLFSFLVPFALGLVLFVLTRRRISEEGHALR